MWSHLQGRVSSHLEDHAGSPKDRNRPPPVSGSCSLFCWNISSWVTFMYILLLSQPVLSFKSLLYGVRCRNGAGSLGRSIIPLFLLLWPICASPFPPSATNSSIVLNGGPVQAMVFYGTQAAAVFPLTNGTCAGPVITLEFWVAPRCSSPACAYFTVQGSNASSYVNSDSPCSAGDSSGPSSGALLALTSAPSFAAK